MSRKLKIFTLSIFSLLILVLFFKTALPLEAKTLLLVLLLKELSMLLSFQEKTGMFYLDITGACRFEEKQFFLSKKRLITSWLMIFEVESIEGKMLFFICNDSVSYTNDFRHLARVLNATSLS